MSAAGLLGRYASVLSLVREWFWLAWTGEVKAANKAMVNMVVAIAAAPAPGTSAAATFSAAVDAIRKWAAAMSNAIGASVGRDLMRMTGLLPATTTALVPATPMMPSIWGPMFMASIGNDGPNNAIAAPGQELTTGSSRPRHPSVGNGSGGPALADTTWKIRDLHPDLIAAARSQGPEAMRWLREHRFGVYVEPIMVDRVPSVTATLLSASRVRLATITFQGVVLPGDHSERMLGLCVAALLDKIGEAPLPTTAPRPDQTRMGRSSVRGGRFIWQASDDSMVNLRYLANGRDEGVTAVRRLLALKQLGYSVREVKSAVGRDGKQVIETALLGPSHELIASVLFDDGVCPTQEARWAAVFYHAGMGFAWSEPADLDIVRPVAATPTTSVQRAPAQRAGTRATPTTNHAPAAPNSVPNPHAAEPTLWEHRRVESFLVTAAQRQGKLASDEIERLGLTVEENVSQPFDHEVRDQLNKGQVLTLKWSFVTSILKDPKTQTKLAVAVFLGPVFRSGMGDSWDVPFFARKAVLLEKAYEAIPDLPGYVAALARATADVADGAEPVGETLPRSVHLYVNPDTGREEPFRIPSAAARPDARPEDHEQYRRLGPQ